MKMNSINGFKLFSLAAVAAFCFMVTTPQTQAQVNVEIGVAPVCPYGYYGPEWFSGGVFIGAGPWFHGPEGFHGHVNNRFHPDHGYHGPMPNHGDKPEPGRHFDKIDHFKGNEVRDGHGHVVGKR